MNDVAPKKETAHQRYDFSELDAAILRAVDEAVRQGASLDDRALSHDMDVRRACRALSEASHRRMFGRPRPEQFLEKRLRYMQRAGILQHGEQGWMRS